MNPTEEMVSVINETREKLCLASPGARCHIYTKGKGDDGNYHVVGKGASLVSCGPFLEFISPVGSLVHLVYTAVESIIYPKDSTPTR